MHVAGVFCILIGVGYWIVDEMEWQAFETRLILRYTEATRDRYTLDRKLQVNPVGPIWFCTGLLLLGGGEIRDEIRKLRQPRSPAPTPRKPRRFGKWLRTLLDGQARPPLSSTPDDSEQAAQFAEFAQQATADPTVSKCACGFVFKILPSMRGKQGKCPKCGAVIAVPA